MDSANTSEIVMAVKIFGAAEGLRPRAVMLANTAAAITPQGPNIHREKTRTILIFSNMLGAGTFHNSDHSIGLHLRYSPTDRQ